MKPQRVSVLVGMLLLGGCDSNDPFRPRLLADLAGDVTPPTLTALGFSPNAINTALGAATVTLSYTLTDDLSGVTSVCAQFLSPSGAQSRANCDFFAATTSRSGSFDLAFPQFGEAGTWKLSVYSIQDAAGNFRSYSQVDLVAAGFPTDLQVTSLADHSAPTLTALSFSPTAINTALGAATVTLSYTLTDDLSGVTSVCAQFLSPSGAQSRANCDFFGATTSRSGSFDVAFPQFGETGTWKVSVYSIQDAAGNFRTYSQADLAAAGFPTDLMVGLLSVSIDIQPGSTLNSIKLSKQGKVTVAILSDASFSAPSRVVRTSLTFGHTGDEQSLASCAKQGEDVNGDGFKDLVCQFYVQKTGFQVGDVLGILHGRTVDQVPIEGKDPVRVLKQAYLEEQDTLLSG